MSDYRSYEVYQRERVGETTNLVNPRVLLSDEYLHDPFTVPGVLRENYPCFRDWVGNRFWVTRYDDVTSIFVDDANFESRPRRLAYGAAVTGRDLGSEPAVEQAVAECFEQTIQQLSDVAEVEVRTGDLVSGYIDGLWNAMTARLLGVSKAEAGHIDVLVAQMQRGAGWDEADRLRGIEAYREVTDLLNAIIAGHAGENQNLIAAATSIDATGADIAVTLLEQDRSTLRSSVGVLWSLLLTHPEQLAAVRREPRLMKTAYLEAMRHSPPRPTADRFTRHEVERFGRLLPEGALIHLSAAASNRDPRQFSSPDVFDIKRKDLCQREPRGQFRADGLPAGITFGYGKPSRSPAVPKETPRSLYALSRDVVVAASLALMQRYPNMRVADGAHAAPTLDRLGGFYGCQSLPVTLD